MSRKLAAAEAKLGNLTKRREVLCKLMDHADPDARRALLPDMLIVTLQMHRAVYERTVAARDCWLR